MKQTLILYSKEPFYVCKRHADCERARKTGHCYEKCFYTTNKSLAAEPNAFYICGKPFEEKSMLIREDKLHLFNLIERRKNDKRTSNKLLEK